LGAVARFALAIRWPRINGFATLSVEQVLDVRDMPPTTASGSHFTIVQSLGDAAQIRDTAFPNGIDDRHRVLRKLRCVGFLDLSAD
jgi:hypothetical protein